MADLPANPLNDDSMLDQESNPELDSKAMNQTALCPPAAPLLCSNNSCSNPGDQNKRCGKCFVAVYCSKDCQIKHWKVHKRHCKENRSFFLCQQTEEHLMCLSLDFPTYFNDHFAGDERGYKRYKEQFDKLGSFGVEKGRGIASITVKVLEILRGKDLVKLRALAELSGQDCFNDRELHLSACTSLLPMVERAHAAGEEGVTEEEVLDAVMALGAAHMWANRGSCIELYKRARKGYRRLLGENNAKYVDAACSVASQNISADERIAEFRRLWENAKVTLPDADITYDIANNLGIEYEEKGRLKEAKAIQLATLQGQRRLLGDEHKRTLGSLSNMGVLLYKEGDYEGALDYYQQAIRGKERVLGKTHPDTLETINNMAITYQLGLKDFTKAEEMLRLVLDGSERSLGKEHGETKRCAKNLAIILCWNLKSKEKTRALIKEYPVLLEDGGGMEREYQDYLREYIK